MTSARERLPVEFCERVTLSRQLATEVRLIAVMMDTRAWHDLSAEEQEVFKSEAAALGRRLNPPLPMPPA